jgi:RND family efflux transporter MFP subunit
MNGNRHLQTKSLWRQTTTLMALGCVLLIVPTGAMAQRGPKSVKVDPVIEEPLAQTVPVLARVVARREGPVAARIAGAVEEVVVAVGDRVAKGDVLARLVNDRRRFERDLAVSELSVAQAQRDVANHQHKLRDQERKRLLKLKKSAAFSSARLSDKIMEIAVAQSEIEAAMARIRMARSQLELREWNLTHTIIRAPYAGVVTAKHLSAGAYLSVGDPVITLVDDRDVEIEADVPARYVTSLAPGAAVAIGFGATGHEQALVRALVPTENPLTRTRAVRLTPTRKKRVVALAIGQSVTVSVPIGAERLVLSVHKDAVMVRGGRSLVVLMADGAATFQPVDLGAAVGGRFVVNSGLKVGDQVVIRGNERLRPGQKIRAGGPASAKPKPKPKQGS